MSNKHLSRLQRLEKLQNIAFCQISDEHRQAKAIRDAEDHAHLRFNQIKGKTRSYERLG